MGLRPGEQPLNVANIAAFLWRHPAALRVLASKVAGRLRRSPDAAAIVAWTESNSTSSAELARRIDVDLWHEAGDFARKLQSHAAGILQNLDVDLGGGGDHRFLYWLTRYMRPRVAVETGVSAGWSTAAILAAMDRNGLGHLYSSDFPYFRVAEPERYIGILVEPRLRSRWTLYTSGDRSALPAILRECGEVDLFHYDSDKLPSGRAFGMAQVLPRLSPDGVVLMDDILNDDWFRQFSDRALFSCQILDARCGLVRHQAAVPSYPTQAPVSLRQ